MSKFSSAVRSMRLRTLPLSLSGVCLGMMLAASDYRVPWTVILFTALTTVSLQVLSNLSNELGDYYHGTDTKDRLGPSYGMMEGGLTVSEMKMLIGGAMALCIVFGLLMIRSSFGTLLSLESVCLMMLGGAAISGAMKYTLGRNPYGYQGLGDIFVFIFFGLVAVLGSYFVAAHIIPSWIFLLPACTIGFFSIGVLNVNNIRDMETDAENRITVAIKLGEKKAKIYQTVLIVLGWICMIAFCLLRFFDPWHYLFVLTLPLFIMHVKGVWKYSGRELDKMLPLLVMSTFAFALLAGFGFLKFLLFR
ncbi:MAG: 1,4-dihydroxy-2-naphthoate octaprenyltransferase [Bacteroidales bacterium]|nr:1,4-dihydroxy-2-naphthoate octaprenyltransferase [Bacteroidales bacterium]